MPDNLDSGLRAINNDQIGSVFRQMGTAISTIVAGRGYIADSEIEMLAGIIGAVLFAVWGYFSNRDAALIDSAVQVPAVESLTVKHPALPALNTKREASRKLTTGRPTTPYR